MSKENSFLKNVSSFLNKIMKQKYISKAEILSLKKMMRKLSESDNNYKQLSNRITTISNSNRVIGKNEANVLQEFYEKFQAEFAKHDNQSPLPEHVWTTQDYQGIPQGSCIVVQSHTKDNYTGTWSSMGGSYPVTVPKYLCKETNNLENIKKSVSVYLKTHK